ncbi:hypothetical protein [Algibacter pectinivorans]|uniref:Uncharacterized protein n=1 Tax=Algibacter pectinivorans TaxID=870482 RepID=A0A1I1MJ10_9FLAO|nr:hypothetical protein [Algibacter pectinivorans]SFC85085.1 hypothetical protein SAMN04487987_101283 [Algibacter pectinivorans]
MINKHIIDFNENLIGLRDFVELIDPFLNEKLEEHDQHLQPLIMSAMIKELLNDDNDIEPEDKEKYTEFQEKLTKDLEAKYSEIPEVKIDKEEDGEHKKYAIKIANTNSEVSKHMDNVAKNRSHIELLYTNSLISSLSSVEWFFSQLLHFFYDKHPESAGVQKRTMTLADLKNFGSIEDAEKYLIDVKIDEILRGNFESWVSLLKSELSLGLGYLNEIMDELIEVYQRRNLFVHNGGTVNSIYLSKVHETQRKGISLNDKLSVNKEYLDNAICKLQKAFILIGAELWKKLSPEDESRGEILGDIVYENLRHSRWDICEGLCYFSLKDVQTHPVDKVIAQINYWLCKKEIGDYKSIEKEINKADFSDKKEIFQLGLYALRGETDKILKILPIVLETNQTNIERIEEFPILREFRETEEYKNFKQESEFFKEDSKEVITPEVVEKE